jgi:hypothetical protein
LSNFSGKSEAIMADYKTLYIGRVRIAGQPAREIWTTESRSAVKNALAGKRRMPIDAQAILAEDIRNPRQQEDTHAQTNG